MARPKSEDKRIAILSAATQVMAERGLVATRTLEISQRAGIAEGTLFTYFRNKEELVNSLYQAIKLEIAEAMLTGFPAEAEIPVRMRHLWDYE